jgi:hypothetical protein
MVTAVGGGRVVVVARVVGFVGTADVVVEAVLLVAAVVDAVVVALVVADAVVARAPVVDDDVRLVPPQATSRLAALIAAVTAWRRLMAFSPFGPRAG